MGQKTICKMKVKAVMKYSGTQRMTSWWVQKRVFRCVVRKDITLGSLCFVVLATRASRCIRSWYLDVEGSSKDWRKEIAKLVFFCAAWFESTLAYSSRRSVTVRKSSTYGQDLGNWLLAILITVVISQGHYGTELGTSALESTIPYAW